MVIGPETKKHWIEFKVAELRKGNLLYVSIRGRLQFVLKHDEFLRPFKMQVLEKSRYQDEVVDQFLEMLKHTQYLLLDKRLSADFIEKFTQFLKDFSLPPAKIAEFCLHCEIHNRVTILDPNKAYILSENVKLCQNCALQELKGYLVKIENVKSKHLDNYLIRVLRKTKDVKEAKKIIDASELHIGEFTAVDTKSADPNLKIKPLEEFNLPLSLQKLLRDRKITALLPIQQKALELGLLENKSQLIVADTSAGKTLVGEIAALKHSLLEKKKVIFTFPLVALANTKWADFSLHYPNLKIGLRVGQDRIKINNNGENLTETKIKSLQNYNWLVTTYESLDYLLRSGQISNFGKPGILIVDEIQLLGDEERGATLDGLIVRIKTLFPDIQLLCLSATIGNPKTLAKSLGNLTLVQISHRPVPLETHLLLCETELDKVKKIRNLVNKEYQNVSSYGYHGQTIVFTNSRRKAHQLSRAIPKSAVYHAGLTYSERVKVEEAFQQGKFKAVVSTFALGAGVDFPASQVILESLMMGNKILTPNEYHQMTGRAGRLGKTDYGRVVILASPDVTIFGQNEVDAAFELIKSNVEGITPQMDDDQAAEQVLATIQSIGGKISVKKLITVYKSFTSATPSLEYVLKMLRDYKLVKVTKNKGKNELYVRVTEIGRACSLSFLSPKQLYTILKRLSEGESPIVIGIILTPFTSVYLSAKIQSYLEQAFKTRFSARFIDGNVLDVLSAKHKEDKNLSVSYPKWVLNLFTKWSQAFFTCDCPHNPYCDHSIINLGRKIVELRIEKGYDPAVISRVFYQEYELEIYKGDLYSWFNQLIYALEGVSRVLTSLGRKTTKIDKLISQIANPTVKKRK